MKLSSQEAKELHKYTKYFALKCAQIIVEARNGKKITTKSKPNTYNTEGFNLNIEDDIDVTTLTKNALNGDVISYSLPLCVEISLQTPEGDKMVLEYWCLNLLPEPCDTTIQSTSPVYNRMGLLLKSLMSVTRAVPAYRLCRRQSEDSFVVCYTICARDPVLSHLGDEYKSLKIGQICTPIGTIQFSVDYRTKLTMSPMGKNNAIMVKSDHFNSNSNSRRHRNNEDISDLTKPMRPGPFADPKPKKTVEPQLPGVTRLLEMAKQKPRIIKPEIESSENQKNTDEISASKESSPARVLMTSSTSSKISTTSNLKSVDEEYWMKELNAPFATRGPVGELMLFYRQCKKSPPLQSPQKNPSPEEISEMIEMYESQLPEYDALVQSFCESPDNN